MSTKSNDAPVNENGLDNYEPIFVARQPIFTADREIWGYELLFRHSGEAATAEVFDANQATAQVIADGYMLAQNQIPPDKRMLINFPESLLLRDTALALPKEQCVPEVLENITPSPKVVEACRRIKQHGYTLAVDDYTGQEGYDELLTLADIIKVDVLGMTPLRLGMVTSKLKAFDSLLLAEKVEDDAMFKECLERGYALFQGFFFARPEIVPGRKISSSQMVQIDLLKILTGDYEIKAMSGIISRDVSLSYRLIKYINSPAFGLRKEVTSIEQALALLGQNIIRQWLMVVLVADINPSPASKEITFLSVLRGRLLQKLGSHAELKKIVELHDDSLFLLGLFSRIDVLMGQTMEEIMEHLPLESSIRNALLGQQSPACKLLHMLDCLETGEFAKAAEVLHTFGLDVEQVALLRLEATEWTKEILGSV